MLQKRTRQETERKKKISLPAALFNKSPSRGSENSSMVSNTESSLETVCFNHHHKQAKYTVVSKDLDGEQILYCEKCAILLASRGFEVIKLDSLEQRGGGKERPNCREQELNSFLVEIGSKSNQLRRKSSQALQQLNAQAEKQEDYRESLEQFFKTLHTLLDTKKQDLVLAEDSRSKKASQNLQQHLTYINQKIEELETMKEDVMSSVESIIQDTPEEDYQLVMSHYKANVADINTEFDSLQSEVPSLPKIERLQTVINQIFENQSGVFFSFDSSQHNQ